MGCPTKSIVRPFMWVKRNQCLSQTVTNINVKQFENNLKTSEVYLELFDMISVSYSASVNAIFECFSCTP
jgi:hypothetical protein